MSNLRITEDGDYRFTEDGDYRVLEGVDIGQVFLSAPAASGSVSTNTPGDVGTVSVTAPAADAVGYTSAVATGIGGAVTLASPTASPQAGAGFSVALPSQATVSSLAGEAQGGGVGTGDILDVTVTAFLGGAVGYTSAVATGDISDLSVTVPTVTLTSAVSLSFGIPGVLITPLETTAGGGGFVTTVIPDITVRTTDGSAVGYTSVDPHVTIPQITVVVPSASPATQVLISGGMPTVTVSGPLGGAVGQAAPSGVIPQITVTSPRSVVLAGGAATGDALPNDINVAGVGGAATGESLARPSFPEIIVTPFEDDISSGVELAVEIDILGVSGPLAEAEVRGIGDIGAITVSGIEGGAALYNYVTGDIGVITISLPKTTTGKKIKFADALFRGLENFDVVRQIKTSN